MEQWSVTEVAEWVATAEVGHENIAENFRMEQVDGEVLADIPNMPPSDREQLLQGLGFVAKGPMMKFVMKIKKLKKPQEVAELPLEHENKTPPTPPPSSRPSSSTLSSPFAQQPLSASNARLPPIEHNHVRVHVSHGQYLDVQTCPGDCMDVVYKSIQAEFPAALLASYPCMELAILRSDPVVAEAQLLPALSLPLVLPTEIAVMPGEAGERDPGLAQVREILEEYFGEYVSWKQDDGKFVLQHVSREVSRSNLVVLKKVVRHLDTIIKGRKVGFLSAVGKPRGGKSTLMTLIGRHFAAKTGCGDGSKIFSVSDSVGTACTSGVWVSTTELTQCRTQDNQDNRAQLDPDSVVLLLDAEGLFADEAGKGSEYFVRLFTIVAVLSSCMILNSKIDNTCEDGFKGFPAQLAMTFESFYEQNEWFRKHKPSVVYLARDWRKLQSLADDRQDFKEAEDRMAGSDGEAATNFIRKAFGAVEFCTLATPVEGQEKLDVLNKPLAPGFASKLKDIIRDIIEPNLKPKLFKDPETHSTHCVNGAAPLEQLLCTLATASEKSTLDWPSALSNFNEKAAVQALSRHAQRISTELEEQFGVLIVRCMPAPDRSARVNPATFKQLGVEAGVQILESGIGTNEKVFRVKGLVTSLQILLTSMDKTHYSIQPSDPQALLKEVRQKWNRNFHSVWEPLRRYNYVEQTVADLFRERLMKHLRPLIKLFRFLLESEAVQVVQSWEGQALNYSDEADMQEGEQKAIHQLDTLVAGLEVEMLMKQLEDDSEVCSGMGPTAVTVTEMIAQIAGQLDVNVKEFKSKVRAKTLSIQQMKEDVVRFAVERAYAAKLGLSAAPGEKLANLVHHASGMQLFSLASEGASGAGQPGATLQMLERASLVVQITRELLEPNQPALLQHLARQDAAIDTVVMEQCTTAESILQSEQTSRLEEQLSQTLQPLGCLPESFAERLAGKFLRSWVDAKEAAHVIVRELQTCGFVNTADICFFSSLEDVAKCVEASGCKDRLGLCWAQRLRDVIAEVCSTLKAMAQPEFQLALYSKTDMHLRTLLNDSLDIQDFTMEVLVHEGEQVMFRVCFATQADMEKVMQQCGHMQDLAKMAFRPPPECWVSPWEDAVLQDEAWSSCITLRRPDIGRIFYNADFEAKVASKFTDNSCLVKGKSVKVLRRFSVVLFPVHQAIDKCSFKRRLAEEVGEDVICNALTPIGRSSLIVCAELEASPQVRKKLQSPRKFDLPIQQQGSCRLILGLVEGEWICSSQPPAGIAQEFARWEDDELQQIKDRLLREIRDRNLQDALELRARTCALIQASSLAVGSDLVDAIVADLEEAVRDQHFEQIDTEIQQVACDLCASFSMGFDPTRHPVAKAKAQEHDLSKQEVMRRCLLPLANELVEQLRNHAGDRQWLQDRISRRDDASGKPAQEIWHGLHVVADGLLLSLTRRARLELVGKIMGVVPLEQFVDCAVKIVEDNVHTEQEVLTQMVDLIYKHKGRRHVPELILQDVMGAYGNGAPPMFLNKASDEDKTNMLCSYTMQRSRCDPAAAAAVTGSSALASKEDAEWATNQVRQICQLFSCAQECQVSREVSSNLEHFLQASEVLAHRLHKDDIQFLLKDADKVFKRLLENVPLGCDVIRQLPCSVRTEVSELSAEMAFGSLDRFRALDAFVTSSKLQDGFFYATLSVWHARFDRLQLKDFECVGMQLAKDAQSVSEVGAFPVTCNASVFFGTFTALPNVPAKVRGVEQLMPQSRRPPPAIPEAGLDLDELTARFAAMEDSRMESQYVQGKLWDAEAARQLMSRCGSGDLMEDVRAQEQAVRVMVMMHTQAVVDAGSYTLKGGGAVPVRVQPPLPARLFAKSGRVPAANRIRHQHTVVKVSSLDSLTAAHRAIKGGESKVLVLNMANRESPGGGYKKGSKAQEEDLFRRTTLARSLDPPGYRSVQYPLEELVPVFSQKVMAFRGPADDGWPLLEEPFELDFISVAAYNGKIGRGGQGENFKVVEKRGDEFRFTEDGFCKTVLNISRLLEAAACEGYNHIILGALGCGAFGNPPSEVAGIFKELLPFFGGCFKVVEFAIIDMTGQRHSNLQIFQKILQMDSSAPWLLQPMDWGSHPASKSPCPRLGLCEHWGQPGHSDSFWHPPRCEQGEKCKDNSSEHLKLRRHRIPCKEPNCKIMFGPEDSPAYREHISLYAHRDLCKEDACRDPGHLHPPLCEHGMRCDYIGKRHPDHHFYAHRGRSCRYGTKCFRWSCQHHMASFVHPSLSLCNDPAWCLQKQQDEHLRTVAHLCEWGMNCKKLVDENHLRRHLHPNRPRCAEGVSCKAHQRPHFEDHLMMFDHAGLKFLRPMCRQGAKCPTRVATVESNRKHVMEYAHSMPEWTLPVCAVYGHNTVRHLMEDNPRPMEVDFKRNAEQMIDRVEAFSPFAGSRPHPEVLKEVTNFLKNNRPVHRLSVASFGKVARCGFLASHHFLRTRSTDVQFAAQLPSVAECLCKHPEQAQSVCDFVDAVVKHFMAKSALEQESNQNKSQQSGPKQQEVKIQPWVLQQQQLQQQQQQQLVQTPKQDGKELLEAAAAGGKKAEVNRLTAEIAQMKGFLSFMPRDAIVQIQKDVQDFLVGMQQLEAEADDASRKGEDPQIGIGYKFDRMFETNKMNFAILGPHTLRVYGDDKSDPLCEGVHLLFEKAVLHHPDVFLTPVAATFYHSGAGDGHRPWSPTGKDNDPERSYQLMLQEKLHPSAPHCFEALAWDFIARAAKKVEKPDDYKHSLPEDCDVDMCYKSLSDVTFKDFMTYWKVANAHYVVECHLPYLTPLTLVEKAILAERSFWKMTPEARLHVENAFGGKLVKTPFDASSKEQYKLASSPLPWPDLPPSFQWTLMAVKKAEVVLPETLHQSQRSRLFFRASAPNFTVRLAKKRDGNTLMNPCEIFVKGERAWARSEEMVARFNEHSRPSAHSVMYCIEIEVDGRVTFKHAGASQMLNSQKLGPLTFPRGLRFVSFLAKDFIQFTDVRVSIGESDHHLYEHEKDVAVVDTAVGFSDSINVEISKDNDADAGSWGFPRSMKEAWKKMFGNGPSSAKPVCSMGLACLAAYGTKKEDLSEDTKLHLKTHRHLCLHGKSCEDKAKPEHVEDWMHLEKDDCPHGDWCKKLTNVQHRAQFHHWGKWDFLVPCRDGLRCDKKHTKHLEKYHHEAVEYLIGMDKVSLQPIGTATDGSAAIGDIPGNRAAAVSAQGSSPYQHPRRPSKLSFEDVQGTVQEDMDDMGDIYNDDAINGNYGDAKLDQYGCPIGDFELAKDGSFRHYKVLIGLFYHGEGLPASLRSLTIPQLEKKGFEVLVRDNMDTFTSALRLEKVHVAWIISDGGHNVGKTTDFVAEVRRFHEAGRGLMVWGDNVPLFVQANYVLKDLFNFELTGNTPGQKELVPGAPSEPGCFDRGFKVCAGIETLYEGHSICYPTKLPPGWRVFGTSSNQKPVFLAKEASSEARGKPGTGRVIVDNGFTKLYKCFWNTAGTARYVSNCTAWLVLRERFRLPAWEQ